MKYLIQFMVTIAASTAIAVAVGTVVLDSVNSNLQQLIQVLESAKPASSDYIRS